MFKNLKKYIFYTTSIVMYAMIIIYPYHNEAETAVEIFPRY